MSFVGQGWFRFAVINYSGIIGEVLIFFTNMNVPTIAGFSEVVQLIVSARQRTIQAVNTSLIDLYWQVGEIISRKIASAE